MAQRSDAIRLAYRPVRPGPVETLVGTLRDVSSRRRLVAYLARADLQKRGSDTLLGNVWWVLDPLLTMVVYVILVAVILRSARDAYPLFIFCAILPWKWFASSVNAATTSVTARERVIKQVHFPKIVLPLATVLSGVVGFVFGLIPLAGLLVLFYPSHISPWVLAIPIVAAVQFVLTLGIAVMASALTVFFRDIGNVAGHALRIWFYLSPALYGTDQVQSLAASHPQLFVLYQLNPFAPLFESYRNLIYYGLPPTWSLLGIVLVESAVLLVAAVLVFRRLEPSFAKVI
jgi:ABC-type polysaccharide/polyol phosphate export permease